MMPSHPANTRRAGFTLIELLITIVMMGIVMGAALSLFSSQSVAFRRNTDRYDLLQNVRGAMEGAERVIRTIGAGTTTDQPVLVYGNNDVIAFNTDFAERDTVEMRWATNFNPDLTDAETDAWLLADATTIPNSSPGYTYPSTTYRLGNGSVSPAETYIFYFALDATTARTDDYVLMQRINAGTPEIVSRNILPHPSGKPFFEYLLRRQTSGEDTMIIASGGLLPLKRLALTPSITSTDSANYTRPDSVRTVRMYFRLTNGLTGAAQRTRDVTTSIGVPNNGIPLPSVCGRAPFAPGTLTPTNVSPSGSGRVQLVWTASTDQASGEQDVLQYIVYRKLAGAATFTDPLVVVRAESGVTSYTFEIADNLPNTAYTFGVAAQDCTPSQSTILTANLTTTP